MERCGALLPLRKPGVGEVDVALHDAQGLVVDPVLIAQFDYGVAFDLQGFASELMKMGGRVGCAIAGIFAVIFLLLFELGEAFVIFRLEQAELV